MLKGITVVITSCNRFDLLEATLASFFKFNTYPVAKILIIEDSGNRKGLEKVLTRFSFDRFETIVNPEQLGQQKSIDRAYQQVETEYIFHCEDDWEFLQSGFMEDSLTLMEQFPEIITVWLRSIGEYPADFFYDEIQEYQGLRYRQVKKDIFTLNPSLKRVNDYRLISNYAQFTPGVFEKEISEFYQERGYTAVILSEAYTNHLGWHRRIHFRDKANKFLELDNRFKQAKAAYYKFFKLGKFK